jgi:fatty-acyl-CoA synthase
MSGYYRNEVADAGVLLGDGWLDTGDIGYLVTGQLVVTGRSKDLIIVGGRNIWPQDVEWAIERLGGVRAGDVAAFAVSDDSAGERMVVVVECRASDGAAREMLRARVAGAVRRTAGVEGEIVLAPPRSLTFTTSGKLSRAAVRTDYLSGTIRDVAGPPSAVPAAAVVANLAEPPWRAAS